MLDFIADLFYSLLGPLGSLIEFIINFGEDVVYLIQLLLSFVEDIPSYFGWLPDSCIILIVSTFTIVVLYKVLGREG